MAILIGEFECKLDAKLRIMVPINLMRQFSSEDQFSFVINRGFERYLNLYPRREWDKINDELLKLSQYQKKSREFVRYMNSGARPVEVDSNNRILIPKNLLEYAGIDREIVLFAYFNKVEIWDKKTYEKSIKVEPDDFSNLAEEVMGHINTMHVNDNDK